MRRAPSYYLNALWHKKKKILKKKPSQPQPKKSSLLWEIFNKKVKEKQHVASNIMTATELEVCRHFETVSISRDANPLDYWRDHCASLSRSQLSPEMC
ncbi:hypothetical protein ElyMa_003751600 [Elysia marginata]|uniref:Uncharacterized protein n=1 Tax=Elysia marginata TaxID=1093978 RepID=A0AAV4F782_9GAST|nr:hypothetical protein ElyMa_003751600 [Elysia marginata]